MPGDDFAILCEDDPNDYEYEHLFEPVVVGDTTLKNRLMMTGHTTNYARGTDIDQQLADYYVERAEGGIGLIVMAYLANHPSARTGSAIAGWTDEIVPDLREMTEQVHEAGGTIFCQDLHYGRQMRSTLSEREVFSASDIPGPVNREMPRAMSHAEIDEIVRAYADTADRIQRSGFDGVEIHSGYGGYFLSQFLSPYSNDRTDEYGGSLDDRMRIVRETLDRTRDAVGDEFTLGLQINGTDDAPGGMDVEEYTEVARRLADTGQVDYLVVKAGTYEKQDYIVPDMTREKAFLAPIAKQVRDAVKAVNDDVVVATTGRITDPRLADRLLAQGCADVVSMTRGHIADPAVATKAREGRLDELIECMGCNQGCIGRIYDGAECRCVLNPATGFESELGRGTLEAAERPREVLIIGGGPAGMKAAEVAAKRGHDVVLHERDSTVGGQVRFASTLDGRDEFEKPLLYLREALDREGVEVHLNSELDSAAVADIDPDAVVVATGSQPPRFPRGYAGHGVRAGDVPGWDNARVLTTQEVLGEDVESTVVDAADPGERVLVLDDGEAHWKGAGTAKHLAARGHDVHFAMVGSDPGGDLTGPTKAKLQRDLFALDNPVELHSFAIPDRVDWPSVTLSKQGRSVTVEDVDSIVVAGFHRAENAVAESLRVAGHSDVFTVGDAVAPRTIMEAIHEGERAAREL